jgi:hypothetical protein
MLPQKNGGRYKPLLLNFQTMKMMTDKKGVEINGKKIQKITCISISYIEKASVLVYSC